MPAPSLHVGWAQTDITPSQPVLIAGQFHARVSEGVADPITATALALQTPEDHVILISCDIVGIAHELRDLVRQRALAPGLNPNNIILNATHTHTAPEVRTSGIGDGPNAAGLDLPVMKIEDYQAFAADRIADAAIQAWNSRAPGAIAYANTYAVIGRNRRWIDHAGRATMYGKTNSPSFSHIEGYEDHSLGIIAAYDLQKNLTGLLVNVPCTSQVSEQDYQISADFWHDTRLELRRRLGPNLFILPQCAPAGDLSPHLLFDKAADLRMLRLKNRTPRQEIAHRIADAVEHLLPFLPAALDPAPRLRHHGETLEVPATALTSRDAADNLAQADQYHLEFDAEKQKLEANPALRQTPRWYVPATNAYRRMLWHRAVAERFERQKTHPNIAIEIHAIALAGAALFTLPFEYYLDFAIAIKARSPATQTFLVQLAGPGTYCPSPRSVAAAGYGSVPASNPTGPQAGQLLAERALQLLQQLLPPA